MRTTSIRPVRCVLYLRVSLDATGEQLAVTRQREDCTAIAADRGWHIVDEYVDNSISASSKNARRPAYDRMVEAFAAGEFDALVCWDLDRLTRQPRQLEDWIDAATDRGLLLVTANGEADLSTDSGRLFARIKAGVARAEVERKAARQKRAAVQRAELGKVPAGVRLTGYTTAGEIEPGEADIVREMFRRFHSGDTLRGLTAWLNDAGVPTRTGRSWNPSSVRGILTNARFAGRAVFMGKTNGRPGDWPAIIDGATFDLVGTKLADPRRRTQVGTDRRHLGSGLYLCGVCDRTVRFFSGLRYRCPDAHVLRAQESVDGYVLGVLRARLGRADLVELFAAGGDTDLTEPERVGELRARLARFEADYDAGLIDGQRFKVATEKTRAELDAALSAQARSTGSSGALATLTAADPVATFDAAPLGVQRTVLGFLMTVRLDPGRRGAHFDPTTVRIDWNHT